MRARLAVRGDDGPIVGKGPDTGSTHVNHRLDGDGHARLQFWASAGTAKIGHLGLLVQLAPYAVPDKLADDRIAIGDNFVLDETAKIPQTAARCGHGNDPVEDVLGDREQAPPVGPDGSHWNGFRSVADPAVLDHT